MMMDRGESDWYGDEWPPAGLHREKQDNTEYNNVERNSEFGDATLYHSEVID